MLDHEHTWVETGRRHPHTGERMAVYVRCACGQIGFRLPPSAVVYTWTIQ